MGSDLKSQYRSHPEKTLFKHTLGVKEKALERFNSPIVEIAALFHDLGKLNPNFQKKLDGINQGYTHHAYLSAYMFCSYLDTNLHALVKKLSGKPELVFSIIAMIAKHHGHLPNLDDGPMDTDHIDSLAKFLSSNPQLPASEYLGLMLDHSPFQLDYSSRNVSELLGKRPLGIKRAARHIIDPLGFFLDTQFAFSALIESDKRDASDNATLQRLSFGEEFDRVYSPALTGKIKSFESDTELNKVRNLIRKDAVQHLLAKLENDDGSRVFTLTAPTGAGKTIVMLALAEAIRSRFGGYDLLYALPFLSISEQVQNICSDLFGEHLVLRVDSKSHNEELNLLIEKSDRDPRTLKELLGKVFSQETFDHPFVITTFVKFFETLVSNRNATLLKLPNFSKRIFLIDEIQALPPRLYVFFVALLDEFCRRFDSYAIISTATMPFLEINEGIKSGEEARKLFYNYPALGKFSERELLPEGKFFENAVFNRYTVHRLQDDVFTISTLAASVAAESESSLVIVNTIQDSKDLWHALEAMGEPCVLLNTHFHVQDRLGKIEYCKKQLKQDERVILVSTQLIEAGVDIDFPVVFRDLCPLPSLIQSAGRCNRNGKNEKGRVYFFELRDEETKRLHAELVYRSEDLGKRYLDFCREEIVGAVDEQDLFAIQKKFFRIVVGEMKIGIHYMGKNDSLDMLECIGKARFKSLGEFRLIDETKYSPSFDFYVPVSEHDPDWLEFVHLSKRFLEVDGFTDQKLISVKIDNIRKRLAHRVVSVRDRSGNPPFAPDVPVLGLYLMPDPEQNYSSETGVRLDFAAFI